MYAYGPVPSRRLGRSLGVSPIPPKTCSYTCVYCQLGRTNHLQVKRESFYSKEDILAEIIHLGQKETADYVTFVGDGEPTLSADLGWLIRQTKDTLHLAVAVITNGSLLFRGDVRTDLAHADVVMPTLDAGNAKIFRAINRPHRSIDFNTMLHGLIDLRGEYSGQIWLEIMLVQGLNDTKKELASINRAIRLITPDRVYVVTPIRPPAEPWVKPPDPTTVLMAQQTIGNAIALPGLESGAFGLGEFSNAQQAIIEIGSHHPLRKEQAAGIAKAFAVPGTVERMIKEKELAEVVYQGEIYLLPKHLSRRQGIHNKKED